MCVFLKEKSCNFNKHPLVLYSVKVAIYIASYNKQGERGVGDVHIADLYKGYCKVFLKVLFFFNLAWRGKNGVSLSDEIFPYCFGSEQKSYA